MLISCRSVEAIWDSANWGNVFGKDVTEVGRNDYGKALIIAQNVLMFASVYYLGNLFLTQLFIVLANILVALTSASFHSHTTSILLFNPFRNVVWFACTILGYFVTFIKVYISFHILTSI